MTDKEIRRMKDGVISIFDKFNILDPAATIGSLRDDILRLIGSMQERPGLKFNVGDKVRNDKIAGLPICTIESIDDTTYYCDYTNFDIIVQDKWELVVEPKDCMYSKDNYTDEDRKVLCDGCKEDCKYSKKEDSVNGCKIIPKPIECYSTCEKCPYSKKSKSVSEDLENAAKNYSKEIFNGILVEDNIEGYKAGANWQKQQLMTNAVSAQCFGFQGAALFSFRLPADKYLVGSEVKVIVIKED